MNPVEKLALMQRISDQRAAGRTRAQIAVELGLTKHQLAYWRRIMVQCGLPDKGRRGGEKHEGHC